MMMLYVQQGPTHDVYIFMCLPVMLPTLMFLPAYYAIQSTNTTENDDV